MFQQKRFFYNGFNKHKLKIKVAQICELHSEFSIIEIEGE